MKSRLLLVWVSVYVGTVLDQNGSAVNIAVVGGVNQRCPAVGVKRVQVSVALNDRIECDSFLCILWENCAVNGCFACDALPVINLVSTVYQVLNILWVCLTCSIIQILKHTPRKFIFAHFQWSFWELNRGWVCTQVHHYPWCLEVAKITGHMKRCVLVTVLLVKGLSAQLTNLLFEITANLAEYFRWKQVFKLIK